MSRRKKSVKRGILPDARYDSQTVSKFINSLMFEGKKSTAEGIFYKAMDMIEERTSQPGVAVFKQAVKGIVTGKPVASGGTLGREKATGQGVVHCITEWAEEKDFDLGGATLTVQGFGNVGSNTAAILATLGVSLVAVGDHTGYLYNPEGFNVHRLKQYVAQNGSIAGYANGQRITREEFFGVQADVFVPAALENQVGAHEAEALQVRLVAEGANGPCSPEGEAVLARRGIEVLPDVLANAGGVTVSYYEWVQNRRSEQWALEEVEERLEKAMLDAYGFQVYGVGANSLEQLAVALDRRARQVVHPLLLCPVCLLVAARVVSVRHRRPRPALLDFFIRRRRHVQQKRHGDVAPRHERLVMREPEQRVTALLNDEIQIAQFVPPHLMARIESSARHRVVKSGSNWEKRPAEMLRKTAAVQLARIEYPEALGGLYSHEELVA